jgi:hypothetical protein
MSSTYSNLKFELIGTGEQSGTWGSTTNTNVGTAIEQALVGMATLTSSDFTANVATLTLSNTNAAQNARALCLNIAAGAVSAAGTINVPAIQKPYVIINGSSYTVTVKVSGLTGVAVPAGKRATVYNNGTDVGVQEDYLPALALGTALPVTSGGTGSASFTVGDLLYANTTTTLAKLGVGSTGQVVTVAGGVPTWASPAAPGTGTVTSVAGAGSINGLTLTGTVTTSGSLTLGGTFRLNSRTISTNTAAAVNTVYVITATLTLTLPASPTAGDIVGVVNMSGVTTVTVARNGINIMALAEDLTVDIYNTGFILMYSNATQGWVLLP